MARNRKTADLNNLLLAMMISVAILGYWEYFIELPRKKAEVLVNQQAAQTQIHQQAEQAEVLQSLPVTHEAALAASPRLPIMSPSLHGSIALKGLRFDDLTLARYRETLSPHSPEVALLSPSDAQEEGYFARFGWLPPAAGQALSLPNDDTVWTADAPGLTPEKPVTLQWNNGQGTLFNVLIALDSDYMFTLTLTATDAGGKPVPLQSFAYINRIHDQKKHPPLGAVHEGPLGVFDGVLSEVTYKDLTKTHEQAFTADSGWLGISDKYWLTAILPAENNFTGRFSEYVSHGSFDHYQVDYASTAAPSTTIRFFAGAKVLTMLENYSTQYHVPLLDRAVDFGQLYFLAKPMFLLLNWFYKLIGNFGIAILCLTVVVKLCLYPLASKSFRAMNQMKRLQPKMTEIRERYKDDKLKMNAEVMALYKKEKVNPASGCLPLLIQLPIFYSLYKVLYSTIEMRHAPFYGWIHDLSAPDPTNIATLFGLLAWNPPAFLHLGVWPIIMAMTMFIQQTQSPPPPDPTQAKMMRVMPFVFLFIFGNVAAGLVIYWSWSNSLSILQQWTIKRRHGDDVPKPAR